MILLLLPLLRLLPFLFSPLARPRTHPTDAQSSGRNSARSSRFPQSVACIIATCGGRPEPVQPVRYAWPPPSVRPPAGAPHLCAVGRMGPKQLTALASDRLSTVSWPSLACRESIGRRQPSGMGFWRGTGGEIRSASGSRQSGPKTARLLVLYGIYHRIIGHGS